jgi:hypothetical protein
VLALMFVLLAAIRDAPQLERTLGFHLGDIDSLYVIAELEPGGVLHRAGFEVGDRPVAISGGRAGFYALLRDVGKKDVVVRVRRGDRELQLIIPFDDPREKPMKVGGEVKPPVVLHRVDPNLESCMRGRPLRVKGIPILSAIITRDGTMKDVRLLKPSDPCIDQAFLDAAKQWRFRPGIFRGKPVAVEYNLTLHIHYR